jgi:hypothetical protein
MSHVLEALDAVCVHYHNVWSFGPHLVHIILILYQRFQSFSAPLRKVSFLPNNECVCVLLCDPVNDRRACQDWNGEWSIYDGQYFYSYTKKIGFVYRSVYCIYICILPCYTTLSSINTSRLYILLPHLYSDVVRRLQ